MISSRGAFLLSSGVMKKPDFTLNIRVRYQEVDPMGVVHHSRYFSYFEIARVEGLRSIGLAYSDLEKKGIYMVVAKASIQFRAPAHYDEVLKIDMWVTKYNRARIDHAYKVWKDDRKTLVAEAETTLACVDRDGNLIQVPDEVLNLHKHPPEDRILEVLCQP